MGNRLATVDMGRKVRGCCAHLRGGGSWLGPHLTQCRLGRGLPLSSRLATVDKLDMGRGLYGRCVGLPASV